MIFQQDGVLYSGPSLTEPRRVWHYRQKCWVTYHGEALAEGTAFPVDRATARKLKVDSPGAAHFMYYDDPPWAQPASKEYWDSVTPPWLLEFIAKRQRERGEKG